MLVVGFWFFVRWGTRSFLCVFQFSFSPFLLCFISNVVCFLQGVIEEAGGFFLSVLGFQSLSSEFRVFTDFDVGRSRGSVEMTFDCVN